MKKKFTAQRGLTRFELALSLAVGLTTVDRLILFGLRSVGHRGRAKTYRLSDARHLARRLAPARIAAVDVLIADYRSHAEDLHDRQQREVETWIADATWRPSWQEAVGTIARLTAAWRGALAERLGTASSAERGLLAWADGPRPAPPTPRRYLEPAQIIALLAGPEAAHPWRPPARASISGLAARGVGISITAAGAWMEWPPADEMPLPPVVPEPWMRPLFNELVDLISTSSSFRGLEAALRAPAVESLPPMPETVDDARAQWRMARAAYRAVRTAVRRGHRRRGDVVRRITEAIATFRARWWQARAELARLAGDPEAVRARAEELRGETLAHLLSLGGWLGEHPATPTKTTRRRKTKTTTKKPRPKRRKSTTKQRRR